ncbi:hypothetical protein PIB30_089787 [Stylosanthes scabra]|uniref:Uncharacterized protein n=1 Tax=Stylosanthes scabra TaxID=79078 RepID=A0ABU6YVX9_9FABA|nr:hypothetical protein [Stylosanthes scabra]
MNKSTHNGYIKGISTLPSGTSSKPYPIVCIRRTPKSLFGEALLVHNHLSYKPPTFRLGTSDYSSSPKIPRRKLGHTIDTCYKKHGLPPHWKQKSGGESAVNVLATTDPEEDNENLRTQLEESEVVNADFTASQREALLALLNKSKVKNIHSINQIVTSQRSQPHQGNLLVHILHFKTSVKALAISKDK